MTLTFYNIEAIILATAGLVVPSIFIADVRRGSGYCKITPERYKSHIVSFVKLYPHQSSPVFQQWPLAHIGS